jgi:uncharacterized sulfatase
MGGSTRNTTPQLESLANSPDGRSFSSCIASGIWTLPSSASILTGTYPSHNTVGIDGSTLPDRLPTVAERFSDVGYQTAGLSRNSHVSSATGLDTGFNRFKWIAASTLHSAAGPLTLGKYLVNIRRHSAGLTTDTAKHATPFIMNDVAKRWLRTLSNQEPYFLYLHYNEPHRPYVPPLPWQDLYTGEIDASADEAVNISMDVHHSLYERVAGGDPLTEHEQAALLAMYDAEVAYTDECIGRLFEFIQSLDGDTIFVVTADHGELFGEFGLLAHKLVLHDSLVNVPLVTHGLDGLALADNELIQHTDLMRTLLEVAGGDTTGMQGVDLREGPRKFAVAQRAPEDFKALTQHDPSFDRTRFHSPLVTCARTTTHKPLLSDEREELFALPDEREDVSEQSQSLFKPLRSELKDWLDTEGVPVEGVRDAEFDDAMRRQLSDLGYMG